jgi:hypothetical protein
MWVFNVAAKWSAPPERKACVQVMGGCEGLHGAGLETQPPIRTPFGFFNDVLQDRCRDAFPQMTRSGTHRFDFAVERVQLL